MVNWLNKAFSFDIRSGPDYFEVEIGAMWVVLAIAAVILFLH
jgi:hypothetical protein